MFFKSKVGKKPNVPVLSGRKFAVQNLGHVLVLGLGVSGKACEEYLRPLVGTRVESLTVVENDSKDPRDFIPENAVEGTFDLCIASPGISVFSDFFKNAESVSKRVISEVEFAWEESDESSVWIAITGTNGKTTTTSLCAQILIDAGLDANAVGNIGAACIAQVAQDAQVAQATEGAQVAQNPASNRKYYVAELSSFQLANIDAFAPDVAVILGIKPDHVEWHKTFEHYVESKMKILSNLASAQGAVAVLDATDDCVRSYIREIRQQTYGERGYLYIPLGTSKGITSDMRQACGSDNAAFVDGAHTMQVAFGNVDHDLCSVQDMQIKGPHNWLDALAAASAAVAIGVPDDSIVRTLKTFKALAHRIEPVGEFESIRFFNDSKATNVDSVLCALSSFPNEKVAVLLGGHDKMTPLDELVQSCAENACIAVCYGEARERFYDALSPVASGDLSVLQAPGLEAAFEASIEEIRQNHPECRTVLLSPACSSYDEFNCFEERGDFFRELVAKKRTLNAENDERQQQTDKEIRLST